MANAVLGTEMLVKVAKVQSIAEDCSGIVSSLCVCLGSQLLTTKYKEFAVKVAHGANEAQFVPGTLTPYLLCNQSCFVWISSVMLDSDRLFKIPFDSAELQWKIGFATDDDPINNREK
jgi:hypothetical protein